MELEPKLWRFHGGLQLPGHKRLSNVEPLDIVPVPARLIHPLGQHVGVPSEPIVEVGQTVQRGQPLSRATGYVCSPIHAGSSGTVVAIGPHPIPHPSGLDGNCIIIDTDGQDLPYEGYPPLTNYRTLNGPALRARVRECGIVGLGGAAFPTAVKLNAGAGLRMLILNGAECEPYISCDDSLMRHRAAEIVAGAQVLLHALEIRNCCIAIEEDKPEAFDSLEAAVRRADDDRIQVVQVPAVYPEGGRTTADPGAHRRGGSGGRHPGGYRYPVPERRHGSGGRARSALRRTADLTGRHRHRPRRRPPAQSGGPSRHADEQGDRSLRWLHGRGQTPDHGRGDDGVSRWPRMPIPVIKSTNCLLVGSDADVKRRASRPRPVSAAASARRSVRRSLLPQQLYWHARADEFDKLESVPSLRLHRVRLLRRRLPQPDPADAVFPLCQDRDLGPGTRAPAIGSRPRTIRDSQGADRPCREPNASVALRPRRER